MNGIIETAAVTVVCVSLGLGVMFILPRPKPQPPQEEQRPPAEMVTGVSAAAQADEKQSQIVISVTPDTNTKRLDRIDDQLFLLQKKLNIIEKKAEERGKK
jgi:hypothetical protein